YLSTSKIFTLSLHDALPISYSKGRPQRLQLGVSAAENEAGLVIEQRDEILPILNPSLFRNFRFVCAQAREPWPVPHDHRVILARSEEHTSELQSHLNLVCRL